MNAVFALTAGLMTFGATVATMAGFGFAIVTMPFLLLLYPPAVAVPLSLVVSTGGNFAQWLRLRRHTDYRFVGLLLAGAIVGLPFGAYVLKVVPAPILKAAIGFVVLIAVLVNLLRRGNTSAAAQRLPAWVTLGAGVGAGILSTSTSQAGLAVSSLMAATRLPKEVVRATLFTFFLASNIGALSTLLMQGILAPATVWTGAELVPFYFLGMAIGDLGFRRSSDRSFRTLMLGILSLSAVVGVVGGLRALLQ